MKIVSDFIDYYDSYERILSSWESPITYLRQTKKVDSECQFKMMNQIDKFIKTVRYESNRYHESIWSVNLFIIGYCGYIRKGAEIIYNSNKLISYTYTGVFHLSKQIDFIIPDSIEKYIRNHFENPIIKNDNVFLELYSPIFIMTQNSIRVTEVVVNPDMSKYDFYKIMSGAILYKEIQKFIDNVLDPLPRQSCYLEIPHRIYGKKWSSWDPNIGKIAM